MVELNKKSQTISDKKDFVVNIPIDSILYDFDEPNQDKVKEFVKSGTKNIDPLQVYQDTKDSKIYLVKGRDELEAFIKLNEENVPVVFSKVAPKETKSKGLNGKVPFFKSRKEAKKYFLDWSRKHLKGKKVHHKELGKDILFSMSGIEHSISKGLTIPKAALIMQAEEMLKNSKYLQSEPDYKGRKEIVAVHRMATTGIVDNEEKEVLLTLREGTNGVIYYDHEIDGIKKLPSTSVGLKSPTEKRSKEVSSAKAQRKDTKKSNFIKKGLKSPAPTKKQIIKHLNTLSHEQFANDAAYILGGDLDRIMGRSEDKAGRDRISNDFAEKIISSEHKENYLKEIGFPKSRKPKKKTKKA